MINTDSKTKTINTDLLYSDLTYKIRGCVFRVYNQLGFGHKELVYQNALEQEFINIKIPYQREVSLSVKYNSNTIGTYRPDFVIGNKLIIETKAVQFMPNSFIQQTLQYLKTTGFKLALLINFGSPQLYIKRLVLTQP